MAGVVAYGAYIPKYRLSRDLIAQAWGSYSQGGEKAVASFDEDSVTMAVAAAFDCLGQIDPKKIDGLYFASTTAPYQEKQCSTLIATVLDLRSEILTADFANSLRAGATAFKTALDQMANNKLNSLLITTAECRLGAPMSNLEQSLGDGAAAFLLGTDDVLAEVVGDYSVADEFTDYWRMEGDKFVNIWEDRFASTYGYASIVQVVATGIMKKYNLKPGDFSKLVLYAPSPRQQADVARRLGFDAKSQLTDSLSRVVGDTGTALASMMLVAALEEAKPGDRILWISHGQGAQAFILEVTPNIEKFKGRRGVKGHLASKTMLPGYEKYVQFREFMPAETARVSPSPSSLPLFWRERKSYLGFYGSKCRKCSLIMHPIQRICYRCQSKDNYEEVRLARTGKIYTYAEDYLADIPVLPQISASIDMDDGSRVYLRLTETEAQSLTDKPQKIGMPVEVTFRKLNDASGFRNYYWKARPVRGGN